MNVTKLVDLVRGRFALELVARLGMIDGIGGRRSLRETDFRSCRIRPFRRRGRGKRIELNPRLGPQRG